MPGEVLSHPCREGSRRPQADVARGHEIESPRHHADYLVRLIVERNLAADYAGRPAEAALPKAVADHHDAHTLVVLILGEDASQRGLHAQHAPEVPRRFSRRNLFGFALAGEGHIARLGKREVGEYGVETPPLNPLRW